MNFCTITAFLLNDRWLATMPNTHPIHRILPYFVPISLLLFSAALRIGYVVDFVEWPDEIWSVWHVRGTFDQAMQRVPADWPPLFSVVTWLWQQIAGLQLETARYLMILLSLLTLAFLYRAACRFAPEDNKGQSVATFTMLTFAVTGYGIFSSVDVRAYGLLLMLGALALWLVLRWMQRPNWDRAVLLCVVLAALIYTSYTSFFYIAFLTLFMVVLRPKLLLRWIGVGVITVVLVLPLLPSFLSSVGGRLEVMRQPFQPLPQALATLYSEFGGTAWFLIPLVVGGVLLLAGFLTPLNLTPQPSLRNREGKEYRLYGFTQTKRLLLAVWVLFPILIYFTATSEEFWKPRYLWWVLIGLALLVGRGAAQLPRLGRWGAALGLVLLVYLPVNWHQYQIEATSATPFRAAFSWLAENIRPDDVLIIDPHCVCGVPYGWDYFVPLYFPTGYLPIREEPGTASRIWYLSSEGWERDEALLAEISDGRKPSIFVGPWYFLLRLYEGPPDWEGAAFGDAVRLNGVELADDRMVLSEDEQLNIKLWWSTTQQLDVDYSISVALLNHRGEVVAQVDGSAQAPDTPEQMSAWQPGHYYEDYRSLTLPDGLKSGDYRLVVTVYQWWDNVRLAPIPNDEYPTKTGDNYLVVRELALFEY